MKLSSMPENFREWVALACGVVPTPLMDTLVGLLLAKTIIAATTIGIFDALDAEPLTAAEIAERCGSDRKATEKLVRALFACKYLKYEGNRFKLAPVSQRWLTRKTFCSLHSAILHRGLDLRFMNFEEYVRHGKLPEFHSALSPEDWRIYHQGQADHAAQVMDEVIERIPLPAHATDLLDLGGGHGLYSVAFCRCYPNLRARVLDLTTTMEDLEAKRASDSAYSRVQFEVADLRTVSLRPQSTDVILLANVVHHFDCPTNRGLMQRVAQALRPGGIVIVIDAFRPSSLRQTGQVEGLLDLYFGAASGAGLWTLEEIREWSRKAGLDTLPPRNLRRMPICTMQVARKAESFA
jgi:ubiquinone/menaquinone biosynthesis C-methylase UbiE